MLDVAFRPDPQHPDPVYRQLADHLAELIAAGRLAADERVPPTRELAAALGLSRNTVTRAYEWLVEAGFLDGDHWLVDPPGVYLPALLLTPIAVRLLRRSRANAPV